MISNGIYLSAKIRIICKQTQSQTQSRTVLWSPRTIGRSGVLSTVRPLCGTTGVVITDRPFLPELKWLGFSVPVHSPKPSRPLSLSRPSAQANPSQIFSETPFFFNLMAILSSPGLLSFNPQGKTSIDSRFTVDWSPRVTFRVYWKCDWFLAF